MQGWPVEGLPSCAATQMGSLRNALLVASHPESGGKGEVKISNLKTGRSLPCQFEAEKSEFGI